MDKEVCILKNASPESRLGARQPGISPALLNGNIHHPRPMSAANAKFNQALLVSLDSPNISSVIQQAKDAKLNLFQPPLNLYPMPPSSNDFGDPRHAKAFEHQQQHDTSKSLASLPKPYLKSDKQPPERSRSEAVIVDGASQSNALYVMTDSGGKLNLDTPSREQFFLGKVNDHGNDAPPLFSALGPDLPQLKKALTPQYGGVANYQSADNLPGPSLQTLNDSYFSLFATPPSASSSLQSAENLPNANPVFATSASPGLLSRQLAEPPMSNGSSSFQSSGTAAASEHVPVVHTRGRKRSKKGPFICPECRKEFSNQSTLTKHMITHSDERKFVCPQCSKAFKRHDHLNGHMLTHREHKPYACDIEGCDKSYCDARSLRRHKEKHKENALNEGLLLSQKLPGLTVTDKAGIASNIYLPVNASAQLQYLALQQQKTTTDGLGAADYAGSSFAKLSSAEKSGLVNATDSDQRGGGLGLKGDEDFNRRVLGSNFGHSNFASENQLLHQLLTTNSSAQHHQEPNVFKPALPTSLQSTSTANSTVIKLNEGYHNLPHELSANHLALANSLKSANHKEPSPADGSSIFSTADKLTNSLNMAENVLAQQQQQETEESGFLDCSICQKKFKSLAQLNGHMRLHGGSFKMNYLLAPKPGEVSSAERMNAQVNELNHHHLTYSAMEQYQQQHQPQPKHSFDNLVKDFMYESAAAAGGHSKEGEFSSANLNMFAKNTELDYHSLNRQTTSNNNGANQFKAPLQYDPPSSNLANASNLYPNQPMYQEKSGANLMQPIDHQQQQQQQQQPQAHCSRRNPVVTEPKQINDMIFSPITPVTPLNKNSSQFTFDFSNANKLSVESKMDSLGGKNNSMQYHQQQQQPPQPQQQQPTNDMVSETFCFEEPKESDLLEKDDMAIAPIDITDSQESFDLNTGRMKDFTDDDCTVLDKTVIVPDMEPTQSEANFDNFDLPSGKLTSDLYNRRLRKHFDDSNRTRELLSIKKIAASLQSFSQSFERNHHHHSGASLGGQPMANHSYSVPTTPLVMGTNYHQNNQETYQANHMSHHSLPTTPIDSAHFTFNVSGQCHQQATACSLPSTPLENDHQFTFAPTHDGQQQQPNEMMNESNFDLSCLNESQYPNDFMYNPKDLDSHFIENESIMAYEPMNASDEAALATNQSNGDLNFAGELYQRNDAFTYEQTCLADNTVPQQQQLPQSQPANKENSVLANVFAPVEGNNPMCAPNSTGTRLNGKLAAVAAQQQQQLVSKEMEQPLLVKDINSNYILESAEQHKTPLTIDTTLEPVEAKSATKGVIKASPLKAILTKKHSPPSSSAMAAIKKKHRPAPLYIPPHVNAFMYHSRLRSPRIWTSGKPSESAQSSISPPPYTPPPMLSPVRSGPGLFWKINGSTLNSKYPSHNSVLKKPNHDVHEHAEQAEQTTPTTAYEPFIYDYDIPQTDVQPHVNIGPNFQARIPAFNLNRSVVNQRPPKEDLLWHPDTLDGVKADKLNLYLKVSRSMCVPGQGNNREYALHLLHQCKGDILEALAKLVNPNPVLDDQHPLADYQYADNQSWSSEEIALFQESLLKNDKDFFLISHEVKSKSVKQCIEFYYLWKKNYPDIIKRLRSLRRKRESMFYNLNTRGSIAASNHVSSDTKSANGSRTLEHELSHSSSSSSSRRTTSAGNNKIRTGPAYECSKCGKKFKKLRSRSAHMKIHGPM